MNENEIYISIKSNEYKDFIKEIKEKIYSSQIKAAISVNKEILELYWFIGKSIIEQQENSSWGKGLIKSISKDLELEFPNVKGFSLTNVKYMRKWYTFYSNEKSPQVVDFLKTNKLFQIPWGHHREIITKCKNTEEALFYIQETIENSYSRKDLMIQMKSDLYSRKAKAITNFEDKLPKHQSDLAIETLKNPYNFDFLLMTNDFKEKELEDALVNNITQFLLELGAGFSYVGRQYKLNVGGDDFYIDLLFYHIKLHSYVVVELKTTKFKPEFAGKLNFYISAVDEILKDKVDNPTIGILICKSKNDTIVEYSLKNIKTPIGVSEFELTKFLPEEFKSSLPSIEEIEAELEEF